ncbi:hypothetical protein [Sinorhizobium meliloti]|uniref:hypothetical protein n=1 Tax=Rhizobium meliloti TaxID=382 RepID=UPI0013E3ECDE|nr:hypothetical protein [Sinorhizobium meliloti]
MKVRFVKAHKSYSVGDSADLAVNEAKAVIGLGLAEELAPEKSAKKGEKAASE